MFVEALASAGFEQPFAHLFDIEIRLTTAEPLVEHFARIYDLDALNPGLRARLGRKIDEALSGRRDPNGAATLRNRVVIAGGRTPANRI